MTHTPHSARLSDGLFAALRATQTLTALNPNAAFSTALRRPVRGPSGHSNADCGWLFQAVSATHALGLLLASGHAGVDQRREVVKTRDVGMDRAHQRCLVTCLSDAHQHHTLERCSRIRHVPTVVRLVHQSPSQLLPTSCSPRYTPTGGRVARPPPFYRWERTSHRHRPPLRRRAAATRATSATKRSPTASPTPDALQLIATATTGPLRRYRMPASCLTLVL